VLRWHTRQRVALLVGQVVLGFFGSDIAVDLIGMRIYWVGAGWVFIECGWGEGFDGAG